jgi:hypothetical protein
MGKVYKGQNKLRIQLTGNVDVSGGTCYIKYRRPDGTEGEWPGTIGTASTGVVYYDLVTTSDLNQAGRWAVWLYVVFSDARVAYGNPYYFTVYDQGT